MLIFVQPKADEWRLHTNLVELRFGSISDPCISVCRVAVDSDRGPQGREARPGSRRGSESAAHSEHQECFIR